MTGTGRDLVLQKVRQMFPDEAPDDIMAILDLYGTEPHEAERERVHLGILKLSQGSVERLREDVGTAKQDFRDILAYAEYPNQMRTDSWKLDAAAAKVLRGQDRKQYLAWLRRETL